LHRKKKKIVVLAGRSKKKEGSSSTRRTRPRIESHQEKGSIDNEAEASIELKRPVSRANPEHRIEEAY